MKSVWFRKKPLVVEKEQRLAADCFLARIGEALGSDPAALSKDAISSHERAQAILARFGGLHVGETGPGQDLASSDVHFFMRSNAGEDGLVDRWKAQLGQLSAIATAHRQHMTVYVDDSGSFYAFADPNNVLYPIGRSFEEAMQCLLLGSAYGTPIPAQPGHPE